jgi:hypothetical protein
MKVWFCIPSVRPLPELNPRLEQWKRQGYGIALLRQGEHSALADISIPTNQYIGWALSVNLLAKRVLGEDSDCMWIVTGGDDYLPDPNKSADVIAAECAAHFEQSFWKAPSPELEGLPLVAAQTMGVMQPTGDPWSDHMGRIIERIAGSPWLGRTWCQRAYEGRGPLCNLYFHNWADEELQLVAIKLGVFWQRPDLVQIHEHWARARGDVRDRPEFATYINGEEYRTSKVLFLARKAAGFPTHLPLRMTANARGN